MSSKNVFRKRIKDNPGLTTFQKKVLIATMDIPKGGVRSYAWVAGKAGFPGAFRAAGQALKKNPYAPDVPCHRVVASDGTIGGYSGGSRKKKRLLKEEGVRGY
ncbi:MGMT family protein [Candidatus Omnitrophota bacterium]